MPQRHTRTVHLLRWSLLALLLLVPVTANADAIPLNDYHENVQRAVTALDTLRTSDEAEAPSSYEDRFNQTIESVAKALPETQSVKTRHGDVNVDNSWLHEALKELKDAPAEQREKKLSQVIDRLKAVEERVVPGEKVVHNDKAQAKQKDRKSTRLNSSHGYIS